MKTKIALIAVLIIISAAFSYFYSNTRAEMKRAKANTEALLTEVTRYRTTDSLNVLAIKKLELTTREFRQHNSDLMQTIDKLNLKLRNLQSTSTTATRTITKIETEVKDSIVFRDREKVIPQIIECLDYADNYFTVSGCIENQTFSGIVESRDTIQQFITREPRRFLFIPFGTKAIWQHVVSSNPNSYITYSQYIEIKNKKGK